jgi:hypothetical protein
MPVNGNEVLWIGDSWVLIPGSQRTHLRDLARDAGALGPNDDYVNASAPATTMSDIANQYVTRQAGATKVKVVLMDGGTWETITASNSGGSVPNAVTAAANSFNQFLTQVASDGTVQDIIYVLVPELAGIPGVAALRPLLSGACAQSAVRCHFLDLDTVWMGHPEYTAGAGGIPIPTEAGAVAIADAIWAIMQAECIAQ